jgi:hypothetical protein
VSEYPIDAVVVFRNLPDADDGKWYMRWLKDGFKHVELWLNDRDVWVRIDPAYELLTLQAHLVSPEDYLPAALKPTFVPVNTRIQLGVTSLAWHFGPLTCVDAVKMALGLRLPLVHTPYQLYAHMTRGL